MRIQMKILLLSLLLVVALIAGTGVLLYQYSARAYVQDAETDLKTLADKLSHQLAARIQQMDFAILFMLSDPDFLSAISTYTMSQKDDPKNQLIILNSATIIDRMLLSYGIDKNFYRASFFTAHGDYFSSHYSGDYRPARPVEEIVADLPWVEKVNALKGRMMLLTPYPDPWTPRGKEAPLVYGVARALQAASGLTCYLEVQNLAVDLDKLLDLPGHPDAQVIIYGAGDAVYYSNGMSLPKGEDWISVSTVPNEYGLYVDVSISRAGLRPLFWSVALQMVTMCAAALLASFLYIYLFTRRLTRPIRALQVSMEQTALENLGEARSARGMDELQSLHDAYQQLLDRLNRAMDAQIRSQAQEMQARFDALQAQIDPHFLYNTLNVIASRAMQIGDDEIMEVCEGIASLLRYSTSTQRRVATIGLEVEHLGTYLLLMKRRYQHKRSFQIDVAESILDQPMPKIVLQPLAENALRHGFKDTGGPMSVWVIGEAVGGRWSISVVDSGAGFDEETLTRLDARMRSGQVAPETSGESLSIGGMGLVNTFARLRAFYGEELTMTLENLSPGARVTIGGSMLSEGGVP